MEQGNFSFLQDPRLIRLGTLAKVYFRTGPPAVLIRLRGSAENIAKEVAARHGLLADARAHFDEVVRTLRLRAILPREVAELLYLKRVGNAVVHEDEGSAADALEALKIARQAAIWFR